MCCVVVQCVRRAAIPPGVAFLSIFSSEIYPEKEHTMTRNMFFFEIDFFISVSALCVGVVGVHKKKLIKID